MKTNLFISTSLLLVFIAFSSINSKANSSQNNQLNNESIDTMAYDSLLAKKLGADKYGMHQYVIAFLKAGPNRNRTEAEAMELQKAHMENIHRLADEGKLIVAGPFLDDGELRGIYIFDVKTIEEAKELTETDPAIIAGSLVMELKPWYGSAALMQVGEIHKRIAQENP